MIKEYLIALNGSDTVALLLLVFFFLLFLYIVFRVIHMDKATTEEISRLPLEDDHEHINVGGKE